MGAFSMLNMLSSALVVGPSPLGRGLITEQALEIGDVALKVPMSTAIGVDRNGELPWLLRLTMRLVEETAKGGTSAYAQYIRTLPKQPHRLLQWSDEELELLQNNSLAEVAAERRSERSADFMTVSQEMPLLRRADFYWAYDLVCSRTVGVRGGRLLLLPQAL